MTIPPLPPRVMKPFLRGCEICDVQAYYTVAFQGRDHQYCDYHLGRFAGQLIKGEITCEGVYWLTDEQWQTFDECACMA